MKRHFYLLLVIASTHFSLLATTCVSTNPYEQSVANTSVICNKQFTASINAIDKALVERGKALSAGGSILFSFTQDKIPFSKCKELAGLKIASILNLNSSINACMLEEMQFKSNLLYATTGIRYFFVTQTLDYFIPKDSIASFESKFCESFHKISGNNKVVVALWLKMRDSKTGRSSAMFFVEQFGTDFLNRADLKIATDYNEGNYEESISYKFSAVYKQLPKPMVLCYQLASASGEFSSCYLLMSMHAAGVTQQLAHVLLTHKNLSKCDSLRSVLKKIEFKKSNAAGQQTDEVLKTRSLYQSLIVASALKPNYEIANLTCNERYVLDSALVVAVAKNYLLKIFPNSFDANEVMPKKNVKIPKDIIAGICKTGSQTGFKRNEISAAAPFGAPTGFELVKNTLQISFNNKHILLDKVLKTEGGASYPAQISKPITSAYELLAALKKSAVYISDNSMLYTRKADPSLLVGAFNLETAPQLSAVIRDLATQTKPVLQIQEAVAKNPAFVEAILKLSVIDRVAMLSTWYSDSALLERCINDVSEIKGLR